MANLANRYRLLALRDTLRAAATLVPLWLIDAIRRPLKPYRRRKPPVEIVTDELARMVAVENRLRPGYRKLSAKPKRLRREARGVIAERVYIARQSALART